VVFRSHFGTTTFEAEVNSVVNSGGQPAGLRVSIPPEADLYDVEVTVGSQQAARRPTIAVFDFAFVTRLGDGINQDGVINLNRENRVQVNFGPANARPNTAGLAAYTIELLDVATGAVVESLPVNGANASADGIIGVNHTYYAGSLGNFRARVRFTSSEDPPQQYVSTTSLQTVRITRE
jgi:hypothetical protein